MSTRAGQVVAAVLLPPLGVFLRHGARRDFWIACALTLIGFVPGMLFALWSVLRDSGDGTVATV